MVLARLLSRAVDFSAMLILSRLLTPGDFGLVALAMTIITILEAVFELPLSQALVQLPKILPHHLHTAFTINLMRGTTLCIFSICFSVPFSQWYGHSELIALIQVLCLAPAVRGLQNPRLAEYAKALNFKYEFYFELIGKGLAFLTGTIVAYSTNSYWAIALFTVMAPLWTTLFGYVVLPYRPRLSFQDWQIFVHFLSWISLSQVAMAINFQCEQILLGKLMPTATLGLFTTANNVAYIPLSALFAPLLRPLLSAFTVMREDLERLRESYQNAASAVVVVGLPLLVGQALVAKSLVIVFLGPRWVSAAHILEWLSLSIIPYLFGIVLTPLGMAMGQTRHIALRNLVQVLVKLPLVVIGGIQYGIGGIVVARLISEVVMAVCSMISIRKMLNITFLDQISIYFRPVAACLIMMVLLIETDFTVKFSNTIMMQLWRILFFTATDIAVYFTSVMVLWWAAGCPQGVEQKLLHALSYVIRRRKAEVPVEVKFPQTEKVGI